MRAFLDAVDQAYRQFDEDRHSSERSQELSSRELQEANSHMRAVFQAVPDAFVRIDARGTIGVAPGPGARPEPRHILLVDDDSKQLDALKRHFHALRDEWTLTTAADGRAALKLVAETSFDFIVTDMLMPTLDGIEVVMALRRQRSEARIGAISGGGRHIGVDTLECARLLGAERTLRKPLRSGGADPDRARAPGRSRRSERRSSAAVADARRARVAVKTVLLVDDDESLRILVRKQDASLEHVLGEVQGLSSVSAADLAC